MLPDGKQNTIDFFIPTLITIVFNNDIYDNYEYASVNNYVGDSLR